MRSGSLLRDVDERRVWSAGVGLRVALGFVVFEFDAVRPFSRPTDDWVFQFGMTPGF
jgi:outer membrane protein assembly factor BamA